MTCQYYKGKTSWCFRPPFWQIKGGPLLCNHHFWWLTTQTYAN